MKYHLHLFDKNIGLGGTDAESQEIKETIDNIREAIYAMLGREEVRVYIQNVQISLHHQKNNEEVRGKCDKILNYIETLYRPYIDESLPISDTGRKKLQVKYSTIIAEAKEEIEQLQKEKLVEILGPLFDIEDNQELTIQTASYLDQFWTDWKRERQSEKKGIREEGIINFCITQNFNSPYLFKYIVHQIIDELKHEDDPSVYEIILMEHSKRIKKIPTKIGQPFNPDFQSIKTMLEDWLKTELTDARIRKKSHDPQQMTILGQPEQKLETTLSVQQLALFIRILRGADIITNKVTTDLLKTIVHTFKTKKVEVITLQSLYNKYHTFEHSTTESLKEILQRLIKELDKTKL